VDWPTVQPPPGSFAQVDASKPRRLDPVSRLGRYFVIQSLDGERTMKTQCGTERQFGGRRMSRRTLIAGGAAMTAGALLVPRSARASAADPLRRIGWLSDSGGVRATFSEALRELGWVEGRNISFETRSTQGQRERSPELAKQLVAAGVEVIVAVAPMPIRAAAQATKEIPIVMAFWGGPDLVESGLIASYSRPGGNITGVDMRQSELDVKRLDLLRQAVPKATKIAVLVHSPQLFEQERPAVREVARQSGLTLEIVGTTPSSPDYDAAFETIVRSQCQALLVIDSPIFSRDRQRIIERAALARLPAIYPTPAHAEGGLIAYGTMLPELERQCARQLDRILRGAKPGELPVEQPSRYQLVINLATARTLGLVLPQALVLQADRIIE
jgi:putative ABC transport system substrate-binding protein